MNTTYHPKGGQCAQCQHREANCSHLPFEKMKPIGRYEDKVIVSCSQYRRINLHPRAHPA